MAPGGHTCNCDCIAYGPVGHPVTPLSGESVSFDSRRRYLFWHYGYKRHCILRCCADNYRYGHSHCEFCRLPQAICPLQQDSKAFSVIVLATTLSYTGPTTLTNGNAATLSAVLTAAQGNSPISGESVTFHSLNWCRC